VQDQEIPGPVSVAGVELLIELHLVPAAPLAGLARTRRIHQDMPHHARCHCEEMRTVLKVGRLLLDQTKIRFVNQRSGLQGVVRALAPQVGGDFSQFPVYDWCQRQFPLQAGSAALAPKSRRCTHERVRHDRIRGIPQNRL
jgi:hypothetical protein